MHSYFSQDDLKNKVAKVALSVINDNSVVALGAGSTLNCLITHLPSFLKDKQYKNVRFVSASQATTTLAEKFHIKIEDPLFCETIDVIIDGADVVDKQFNLIKGGGGALLREKILAQKAKQMVIIVDETKIRSRLGGFPLPVEIIPFAHSYTVEALKSVMEEYKILCDVKIRKKQTNEFFITDGGHNIVDIFIDYIPNTHSLPQAINNIAGVVDNGLFINMADIVFVAKENGEIERNEK